MRARRSRCVGRRSGCCSCVGTALTVLLASAQGGLLLVAGRDGTSQVLEYLAPSTPVWTMLPTFLRQPPLQAAVGVLLWAGLALLAGHLMGRGARARQDAGRQHSSAWTAIVVIGWRAVGRRRAGASRRARTACARRARARPPARRVRRRATAARHPLRSTHACRSGGGAGAVPHRRPCRWRSARGHGDAVVRATALAARRHVRRGSDIPAVDERRTRRRRRSTVRWPCTRDASVRRSRHGRCRSRRRDPGDARSRCRWTSASSASRRRRRSTDASPRLRLTPQRIVDASARPQTPAVLGSQAYAGLSVLVHGEDAWPEPTGLWLRGRTTVMLTLVFPDDAWRTFDLRAGAVPVKVTAEWGASTRDVGSRTGRGGADDHRRARAAARPAGAIGATAHHDVGRLRARRDRPGQS